MTTMTDEQKTKCLALSTFGVLAGVTSIVLLFPWLISPYYAPPQWADAEWKSARCRVYAKHLNDGTLSMYQEVQYEHDCNGAKQ